MSRKLSTSGMATLIALFATSCVSAVSSAPLAPDTSQVWSLKDALPALRSASCENASNDAVVAPFALKYTALDPTELAKSLPENVSVHGAWHVTSDHPNWGGVSGIDYAPDGSLIAVSDRGAIFDISLSDNQPNETAQLTYLLGPDGKQLAGKKNKDSEGIALYEGAALISFERNHRIDLYDIQTCGASARPATVSMLPGDRDGYEIDPNRGAEALAISESGTISFAYETPAAQSAQLGVIGKNGQPEFLPTRISTPLAYAIVGRDQSTLADGSELTADLLRSYDPVRGLRTRLRVGSTEITLAPLAPIDNFEGVALQPQADGSVIVWIISDNNFSADQRTLLFAFRIAQK